MKRALLAVLFAGLGTGSASCQEMPSEAVVSTITQAGMTQGCSVEYTAMSKDYVYKAGAPIGITGSLAWMFHQSAGVGLSLKILGFDVDRVGVLTPLPVAHGFVRINNRVFQVAQKYKCDQIAGFCGVILKDDAFGAMRAFIDGGEVVAFGLNRKADGMDVLIALPTLRLEQRAQIVGCFSQIIKRIRQEVEGAK